VVRPDNIRLSAGDSDVSGRRAKISDRTFLGNISEYSVSLDSSTALRVQTHPAQVFAIGEEVAIEIDAMHCTVFRSP
jgi:ABC-type Fe3+/spermidine/putrescine transport system ATPase subunit